MNSLILLATLLIPQIQTEAITYGDSKNPQEGFLAYDANAKGARPGILIVHDWMGLGDEMKSRAKQLAALGYVAFAADIYGKGIRPKDSSEASKLAGSFKADRALLRSRINAALTELKKSKKIDPKKIVAIGYCFGGTTALELARSGAPVAGIVSFHGGLQTPTPQDAKNIKAKVLVLHGADDPYVPETEVTAFQKEMRDAKTDWRMISYGGAVHSFTIPSAGNDHSKGAAYNEKADKRSWQDFMNFLKEVVG